MGKSFVLGISLGLAKAVLGQSLETATKPPVLLYKPGLLKEFSFKSLIGEKLVLPFSLIFLTVPPLANCFGHDFSLSGESLLFHYNECSDKTSQVINDLCVLPRVGKTESR
ncbi:hypothetical protein WISP_17075 [Willisornis vidua]|uniref:Uncharacterized protein n=1 Tax=Willisornis vidua TaxID=1566151 RepID=A0ABQ9DU00_9PASS|nr:hypothetical protein WISP_17075 [Willisornis vidua]